MRFDHRLTEDRFEKGVTKVEVGPKVYPMLQGSRETG